MVVEKAREPQCPTQDEGAQHEYTHLPYRSWCKFCVVGRGRQEPHMKAKHDSENEMPEISIDYAFPASVEDVGVTMLVARDRRTRMTCSTVVPRKGTTGAFAARRLNAFLREIGAGQVDVIMKSDGEAAIKAVIDDVAALRPTVRTIREEAPRGSSASNGIVERAIQSVAAQVKVLKLWLESKWLRKIPDDHPAITWLVEYASVLLNRCEISKDGATAYRRLMGEGRCDQGHRVRGDGDVQAETSAEQTGQTDHPLGRGRVPRDAHSQRRDDCRHGQRGMEDTDSSTQTC